MSEFCCWGKDCPNHCCGPYDGVSPNLRPLGSVKMSEIILLPKDVEALKEAGCHDIICRDDSGIDRIDTAPDGTCAALIDGKCSIYSCRPTICKAYPLYLDMFTGVCALTECCAVSDKMSLDEQPEMLESLLDIYQYWIDYYRTR